MFWGFANFVVAYLLIAQVGNFDLHAADNVIASGVGVLLMAVMSARGFGHFTAATRLLVRDGMAKGTFRSLKVFNYRLGPSARLSPISVYGCSARLRTGWC